MLLKSAKCNYKAYEKIQTLTLKLLWKHVYHEKRYMYTFDLTSLQDN